MQGGFPKVSAVVVSYNTRGLLRKCLASLGEADEVIVVDNASRDGSAEMVAAEFPRVKLVRNSRNLGFGAANNQGLGVMSCDVALLFNSDAEARPGAIPLLAALFADPTVVAAGGRLVHPDGEEQNSCCSSLTLWAVFCEQTLLEKVSPQFSPYWLNHKLVGPGPHEVEQVMGACLMLRPVERFDERFFLYCEDTELCRRLRRHGRVLFLRAAEFEHALGASSCANRWQAVARYNRGKELYFWIHHGVTAMATCFVLDRLGALLRLLVGLLTIWKPDGRVRAVTFLRVFLAPPRGPSLPPDSAP